MTSRRLKRWDRYKNRPWWIGNERLGRRADQRRAILVMRTHILIDARDDWGHDDQHLNWMRREISRLW